MVDTMQEGLRWASEFPGAVMHVPQEAQPGRRSSLDCLLLLLCLLMFVIVVCLLYLVRCEWA